MEAKRAAAALRATRRIIRVCVPSHWKASDVLFLLTLAAVFIVQAVLPMASGSQTYRLKGYEVTATGLTPDYPAGYECSPLTSLYASWTDVRWIEAGRASLRRRRRSAWRAHSCARTRDDTRRVARELGLGLRGCTAHQPRPRRSQSCGWRPALLFRLLPLALPGRFKVQAWTKDCSRRANWARPQAGRQAGVPARGALGSLRGQR